MYGTLTVRLVVDGEHLSASVNGVEVLTVESLKQASVDRGREAATGDRVGVQAWSSSDLVIDTLRVAAPTDAAVAGTLAARGGRGVRADRRGRGRPLVVSQHPRARR